VAMFLIMHKPSIKYNKDIKMRYLTSRELADVTGFHPDTELGPNETTRKKHIGNAVPPVLPKRIVETLYNLNIQQ